MANNNFFLSQDPLLYQGSSYQRLPDNDNDLQRQLNDTVTQYRLYQQQNQNNNNINMNCDYLGDLDRQMRGLSQDAINMLDTNEEYKNLTTELTDIVQKELMNNIKWKINSNQNAIQNINKQLSIINSVKRTADDEQRKNMSELNDYVKNYSNITFDEYKKIKNNINELETNNKTSKKKNDK